MDTLIVLIFCLSLAVLPDLTGGAVALTPPTFNQWVATATNYANFKKTGAVWMPAAQVTKLPKQYISAETAKKVPPVSFDARTYWPKCTVINETRNQGECACCWAHAVAGALSDRLCITSKTQDRNVRLSAQDLIQCCDGCGTCGSGCKGGLVELAYDQFVNKGIVSGGDFGATGTAGGCSPFLYDPNFKDTNQANLKTNVTCSKKCSQSFTTASPSKNYNNDAYMGIGWFMVTDVQPNGSFDIKKTEHNMQLEIYVNGSVTVNIEVYADFYNYTKGVYNHSYDRKLVTGFHSLRVIGWGMEDGKVPYWLVANSWGKTWGQNGFGKIYRGANVTGIEARVSAATPSASQGLLSALEQIVLKAFQTGMKALLASMNMGPTYSCDGVTGTEYRSSW